MRSPEHARTNAIERFHGIISADALRQVADFAALCFSDGYTTGLRTGAKLASDVYLDRDEPESPHHHGSLTVGERNTGLR